MFDVLSSLALLKPVFEIKDRIHIFISQFPFLGGKIRQQGQPFLLQKTVVQHIEIPRVVHLTETLDQLLFFLLWKVFVFQGLDLIDKSICHSIHTGEKRNLPKFVIEKIQEPTFCQGHIFVLYRGKIHQFILQAEQEAFHMGDEVLRLFFKSHRILFIGQKIPLDLITAVLTVGSCSLELAVGKKIKAHFLYVFLTQLRKNVGNVVGKDAVWG